MKKLLAGLLTLWCATASAQSVQQSGVITPGHAACWAITGVIFDCGSPGGGVSVVGSTTTNDFVAFNASGSLIDSGINPANTSAISGLWNFNGGATTLTRPLGDNSTNIATTAFVNGVFTGPQTITSLWTFDAGIFGNNSPAIPAFPGGAPYYFTIPSPANGYSTIVNGFQVSLGTPLLAASQFGENAVGIQQAIVGTVNVNTSDPAGNAAFAISGYGLTNSTATGAVGIGGFGLCGIQNCNEVDGANQVVANAATLQGGVGFDYTLMIGNQVNVNLRQKSGATNPSGPLYGYYVVGGGNATNNTGNAYAADRLSIVTAAKWNNAFASFNGAALVALSVGTNSGSAGSPPASSGSQTIQFTAYDSSVGKFSTIAADQFGDIILSPNLNVGAATVLEDGLGNSVFSSGILGNAVVIAGTTTNPALSFTNCGTNCGLLAPGANELELVVGGVNKLDYGITNGANFTFAGSANVFVAGILLPAANVAATNTTSGSLRVTGGIGVTGAGFFGSTLSTAGQIISTFGATTIASGACGATANGTVAGTNASGLITIGAAATTTCTVSFSTTITAPGACVIFPANATAAVQGTTLARVSSVGTTNFVITGAASQLASANYYYICL